MASWLAGDAVPQRRYHRSLEEAFIGDVVDPFDPPLSRASDEALMAEVVRRMGEATRIRAQAAFRFGETPPDLADRPGLIRGPSTRSQDGQADSQT